MGIEIIGKLSLEKLLRIQPQPWRWLATLPEADKVRQVGFHLQASVSVSHLRKDFSPGSILSVPRLQGQRLCLWGPRSCQRPWQGPGSCHTSSPGPSLVWHDDRIWPLFHHVSVSSDADHRTDKLAHGWWLEGMGTSRSTFNSREMVRRNHLSQLSSLFLWEILDSTDSGRAVALRNDQIHPPFPF